MSFLGYMFLFSGRISGVTSILGKIQQSLAALDRMADFLNLPKYSVEMPELPVENINSVAAHNLSAKIEDRTLFSGCSFEAN